MIRAARNVFAILFGLAFFGWLFWPASFARGVGSESTSLRR